MNKIYINKRINKEIKKAADDELVSTTANAKPLAPPKKKRKRRAHRSSALDDDLDYYNLQADNTIIEDEDAWVSNYVDELGYQPLKAAKGTSREDKKLHYYLEMIKRQEESEKQKTQKKEAKLKVKNNPEKKIWKIENDPEPDEPINFTLIEDFDWDLNDLALHMHECLILQSKSSCKGKKMSDIQNSDKDDTESLHHSENISESTLDRLRTPPQATEKFGYNLFTYGCNNFKNLKISTLRENFEPNQEAEKKEVGDLMLSFDSHNWASSDALAHSNLKNSFWESILNFTRKIQNKFKDVKLNATEDNNCLQDDSPKSVESEPLPVSEKPKRKHLKLQSLKFWKSKHEVWPKLMEVNVSNNSLGVKPVFLITRSKGSQNNRMSRLSSSISTIASMKSCEANNKLPKSKWTIENAAVLLVI